MNSRCKALTFVAIMVLGLGCGSSTKMPAISQLNPTAVTHGAAQFQLEVDGSNFASNAFVSFNGAQEPTTFSSSSKLEATIPASAIMSAATVPVTVTNPGSGGLYGSGAKTSAAMNFTIN